VKQRWKELLWLLPLVALGLGLGLSMLVRYTAQRNPVLYLRIDLATLILITGVVLTLASYAALWVITCIEKQRQRLTSQASDDRLRFLRRLDHELKNPLTAMRAGLANANEAPDEAARREAFGTVETQALRLSRLAADLRKLAELETRPLERAAVNIAIVLQETFDLTQERNADRQLSLSIPQAPWPLPQISGDPDLLFLAVHNLLENAVKFTCPGDRVEVRAFEDGSSVVIEVADTGPGIPEDELPHVWEELYRGQGARGVPGSGLGLALVRAVIERHGGRVSLRSRVGQGSVFTVRLPAG
jgi:two-component system, OmpR family, sensor kinase